MFICQQCKQSSDKPVRAVTKVRVVNHRAIRRDRKTKEERSIVVGRGTQIVEEKLLCKGCGAQVLVEEVPGEPEETVEKIEREDETDYGAIAQRFEEEGL
jgi:hypothetical protein